jgi:hypothetical protein
MSSIPRELYGGNAGSLPKNDSAVNFYLTALSYFKYFPNGEVWGTWSHSANSTQLVQEGDI